VIGYGFADNANPGTVYAARRDGTPLTLVGALEAVRGCGNVTVVRLGRGGWTDVVRRAGSDAGPLEHAPTGRAVRRRRARWAR
jgi:hypothetical protein